MKIDLRKVPFYYLNLESQPERREKMEKLLSSLELEEYSRIEAIHNDWGHLGCSQSFAESLAILKKRGGPFVFLEDDVDLKRWEPIIDIPDDADAFYLGIHGWGRMNGHSGPCTQYQKINNDIVKVKNMLGLHSILYIKDEWIEMARRACEYAAYDIQSYCDIPVSECQRFYNIYAFDNPYFYQTSAPGNQAATYQTLSEQNNLEIMSTVQQYWLPQKI